MAKRAVGTSRGLASGGDVALAPVKKAAGAVWGRLGSRCALAAVAVGGVLVLAGSGVWLSPRVAAWGSRPARMMGEAPVTATDLGARRAVTSPVVARDPTTPEFVAAATRTDAPGPDCELAVSGDGGDSWWPVAAIEELPEGLAACYAPGVGFDADGRLVFWFVGMEGPPPQPTGLWVVTSPDHAQTFTQPRKLAEVSTAAARVALGDRGGLQAVWLDPLSGGEQGEGDGAGGWPLGSRVVAAVGDVGGLGEPVTVAEPDGLVAAPTVAVGADGGAVVAYYQLPADAGTGEGAASLVEAGPWRLMVARRPPGEEGFGEPVSVAELALPADESIPVNQPRFVTRRGVTAPGLATGGGRVCASWTSLDDTALDAWVRCTDDGGETWGKPVQLGAELAATFQWLPQVAVTDAGRVAAVFYHHRDDAEDGRAVDTYYAATDDPRAGFGEAQRLSSQSSLPRRAPIRGWFGTQLGLTEDPSGAVAMWADSRHGIPQAYPSQTVVAATLDTPAAPAAGPYGWAGGGLVAGGLTLAAGGVWWRRRHPPGAGPRGSPEPAGRTE